MQELLARAAKVLFHALTRADVAHDGGESDGAAVSASDGRGRDEHVDDGAVFALANAFVWLASRA